MEPLAAEPPDDRTEEFAFNIYGPRVPALLISPRAPKTVVHTTFDHTSVLRYVCDKWELPYLTERDKRANSIGSVLDFMGPLRADTPPTVQAAIPAPVPADPASLSVTNHEQGLLSFARYLDAAMQHQGDAAVAAYHRLEREYQHDLDAKIEVAIERFHLFLQGTKTHMKGVLRDGTSDS